MDSIKKLLTNILLLNIEVRSDFLATIYIYNNNTNIMEIYQRGENEVMPYVYNNSLTVGEFRGSSNSMDITM